MRFVLSALQLWYELCEQTVSLLLVLVLGVFAALGRHGVDLLDSIGEVAIGLAGGGGSRLLWAVDALLEDGLGLNVFKLGLEVTEAGGVGGAVGAAAIVGEGEIRVLDFFAFNTPSAFTGTVLLDLLGVGATDAVLGEETGKAISCSRCTSSKSSVVTLVDFVRSGHDD